MRPATCPAVAELVEGARSGAGGIVCGVVAGAIERDGQGGSALIEERRDASTIAAYCTGRGVPQDAQRTHGGFVAAGERTCYSDCPVWRAEKDRLERARAARLQADGVLRRGAMPERDVERVIAEAGW